MYSFDLLAAELRVLGAVNLTHAAFAQLSGDSEVGQRLADQGVGILPPVVQCRGNVIGIRPPDAAHPPGTTDQSVFAGSRIPA